MPIKPNPYQVQTAYGDSIGRGMSNIAQAMMTDPNAGVREAETMAWQGRKLRDDLYAAQDERVGQHALAQLIEDYTPEGVDPRAFYAEATRRGAMEPGDVSNLMLGLAGNMPASDEQRFGAMIGAGKMPGTSTAVSKRHQGELLDREFNESLSEPPTSRDAYLARLIAEGTPREEVSADRDALYGSSGGTGSENPWLDAKRRQDVLRNISDAVYGALGERGVPADEDGYLRTDLLTPGYTDEAIERATSAYVRDMQEGVVRPVEAYVADALQGDTFDYTEDNSWWWGRGEEELTRVPGPGGSTRRPDAPSTGGATVDATSTIVGPDGSRISYEDVLSTAEQEGVSPEQVIRDLGLQVIPGA